MDFRWHPEQLPPPIEGHSKAKLTVLRSYLRAYFDRLGGNFARDEFKLDFVDGFAGGGTFQDGDDIISGTPLIMLEESAVAKERLVRGRTKPMRFDFKYYFVDKETAHTDHLRKVLQERGYQANGGEIVILNRRFEEVVDNIIAEVSRRQPRAGRSIFLLDQTGYSQVELSLVARILRELRAAEVILTFAADILFNFLNKSPEFVRAVSSFGLTSEDVRHLIQLKGGAGGLALAQRTLREHIRFVTGANFDTPFFIQPRSSRRALWFLHLSRHPTARDVMMQCHWNLSNTFKHYGSGDFEMLGWDDLAPGGETLPLFDFREHDKRAMKKGLLDTLPEKLFSLASEEPVTIDAMRYMFANQTAARFSDYDSILLELFRGKELNILNPDGKVRARTLKRIRSTDRIAFPKQLLLPGILRRR